MLVTRSPASAHFLLLEMSLGGRYILDLHHSATRMMYQRIIKANITPLFIWIFDVVHQICIPRLSRLVETLQTPRFPRLNQLPLYQRPLLLVNRCISTVSPRLGILFPVMRSWERGQSTMNGTQTRSRWQKCKRKKLQLITAESMQSFMPPTVITKACGWKLDYLKKRLKDWQKFTRIGETAL